MKKNMKNLKTLLKFYFFTMLATNNLSSMEQHSRKLKTTLNYNLNRTLQNLKTKLITTLSQNFTNPKIINSIKNLSKHDLTNLQSYLNHLKQDFTLRHNSLLQEERSKVFEGGGLKP